MNRTCIQIDSHNTNCTVETFGYRKKDLVYKYKLLYNHI